MTELGFGRGKRSEGENTDTNILINQRRESKVTSLFDRTRNKGMALHDLFPVFFLISS